MKKLLIAAAFLLAPLAAHATDLKFPSDAPIATVTFPDTWSPKETDSGVDAVSPDNAIYISLDVAKTATLDKVIDDAVKFLGDRGVTVDDKSVQKTEGTFNGLPAVTVAWAGKDKDGAVEIDLTVAVTGADKALVITYWGSKDAEASHAAELKAIAESVKPVK